MHWFIDPIKEHYVDFDGRVSVKEYWMFILFYVIFYIVVSIIGSVVGLEDVLTTLFSLAVLLPSIAIAARRLHDINKSGWWQLIGLIPIVGWIILIVWLATKSDAGSNRFGEVPVGATIKMESPETPSETQEKPEDNTADTTAEESTDTTEEDK